MIIADTESILTIFSHDIPMRLVNMYAGERLGWIEFTIEKLIAILEEEVQRGLEVLILYDIACQLEPYLAKRDSPLAARIKLAVNKFHGYAHEFRCQELWGASQLANLGESDGEGTERIWALLRVLVTSGYVRDPPSAFHYPALATPPQSCRPDANHLLGT